MGVLSTWGISMVKDEADVIEGVVRHMLTQVDHVMIADNMSSDGTLDILRRLELEFEDRGWRGDPWDAPRRIDVLMDTDPAHYQSRKMTAMARTAALEGADWVVPFDADEVWYACDGRTIAEALADVPPGCAITPADLYLHVATSDDPEGSPTTTMGWRQRRPLGLPKVACRPAVPVTIAEGNHGASYGVDPLPGVLEVRHFPYRSPEQFVRKARNGHAALSATTLPRGVGEHWRVYGEHLQQHGEESLQAWFREHFYFEHPRSTRELVFDPAPLAV